MQTLYRVQWLISQAENTCLSPYRGNHCVKTLKKSFMQKHYSRSAQTLLPISTNTTPDQHKHYSRSAQTLFPISTITTPDRHSIPDQHKHYSRSAQTLFPLSINTIPDQHKHYSTNTIPNQHKYYSRSAPTMFSYMITGAVLNSGRKAISNVILMYIVSS